MRSDPLAEGGTGPSADRAIKRILAKRPAISAEPKPACRPCVTKQRTVVFYIPIDAGGAPARQQGQVQPPLLGLLGGNLEAPSDAILDQRSADFQGGDVGK